MELIGIQEWFLSIGPVFQSLLGGMFTWTLTAFGAALVFFTRGIDEKGLDFMLGFAAGAPASGPY